MRQARQDSVRRGFSIRSSVPIQRRYGVWRAHALPSRPASAQRPFVRTQRNTTMIQALRARRVRHGLVVAFCVACLLTAVPQARAVDTSTRTAAEIQSRWRQLKPVFSGSPYLVAPTLSAPFAAGSLNGAFLQDGLNSINYARYLAGLPDDVVLDATYTDRAQHGAVLLAVGQFAHSQPQPRRWTRASTRSPTMRRVRATSAGATARCGTSTSRAWATRTRATSTASVIVAGCSTRR